MVRAWLFSIIVRSVLVLAFTLAAPAATCLAATIVVFGDSLAAGYGLPREQGWVHLLGQRLRAEQLDYKVVNASISGETTLGGVNRIGAVLKAHRPALVILELGANDGLRGATPDSIRRNLEAITDACRRAGARVLLVGIRIPPNYGKAYTEEFQAVFLKVARSRKIPLVPFLLDGFSENRALFQDDGIHPTAAAQPLMLETVWTELRPLLK
jgi:acyl-CoA thioesterase-1